MNNKPKYIGPGVCERCQNKRKRLVLTIIGAICDTCIAEAIKSLRKAGSIIRHERVVDSQQKHGGKSNEGGAVQGYGEQ